MSQEWILTGLIKIDELESRVKNLLHSSYDLPELHVKDPEWMDISDVEDFIREACHDSQNRSEDFSVTLQFGKVFVEKPILEQNWLKLVFNPQLKLRVKDTFLFQIETPTSYGSPYISSRSSWGNIEKILLLLNPYFVFSSDYRNTIAHLMELDEEDILEKPWEYYWNTSIYSKELVENLSVKNIDFKENIYYYKILKNSSIWFSSPYGLGNERLYDLTVLDTYNSRVTITDSKIEEFVKKSEKAHRIYLTNLMRLKG